MSDSSYPRVLVISHNVFSDNTSMGKTLSTFFYGWDKEKIAQLYFHSGVPTNNICNNFYRITDIDAIKSILNKSCSGDVLNEKNIDKTRVSSDDTDGINGIYNFGRKRLPIIYILRDIVRSISIKKNKKLYTWLKNFRPEIVFFASGDYEFPYHIALEIALEFRIPLVICCFDDYYLFNENHRLVLGKIRQKHFMKTVNKTMHYASHVFTVSDLMAEAYKKLFGKSCSVLYTATYLKEGNADTNRSGISYLGGLGLNRDKQLVDIGLTLKDLNSELIPKYIDVYSGETNATILKNMTIENGICFHGAVPQDKVANIIEHSIAVIHTESFVEDVKCRVMYSVSTKIPDSLATGACLLAYGPNDVASIDYLARNEAAFVASNKEELKQRIKEIFESNELREKISANAIALAKRNHDKNKIPVQVKTVLLNAISSRYSKI